MITNLNHPLASEALSRREQAVHDHLRECEMRQGRPAKRSSVISHLLAVLGVVQSHSAPAETRTIMRETAPAGQSTR